ncbi:MAG: outer membrane beta-barrel protein [Kofleriaceae bacterium]|nr:outer membrane beta-barrel protein [Kofleriaceae bacterium]
MARRWAVAVAFGPEILRSKLEDAPRVTFGTLELSGRFRIKPAMEVSLGLRGGGAARGDLSTGGLYADFRYRFRPDQPLDVYGQVGLGVISVAGKNASDVEKKGRGALRLGAGVEWRFAPLFGVAFELRFVGIGENAEVPTPIAPSLDWEMSRYGVSGTELALDTSFYF